MELYIEGDLNINIIVSDDDGIPVVQDISADACTDTEEEKDEAEMIVMMLCPGGAPKVLTYGEACEMLPGFADYYVPVDFKNSKSGLTLYFPEEKTIKLGKEVYLFGNAVICSEDPDGDLWSLSGGDIYEIFQYAEENSITLCADGRDLPAIQL
ncbi:MAG: hypothetical protein LUG93_05775 [Lachnospiraceae bacterium]|nr:hypothetical protein [Lachnospiraceae bacterium]